MSLLEAWNLWHDTVKQVNNVAVSIRYLFMYSLDHKYFIWCQDNNYTDMQLRHNLKNRQMLWIGIANNQFVTVPNNPSYHHLILVHCTVVTTLLLFTKQYLCMSLQPQIKRMCEWPWVILSQFMVKNLSRTSISLESILWTLIISKQQNRLILFSIKSSEHINDILWKNVNNENCPDPHLLILQ